MGTFAEKQPVFTVYRLPTKENNHLFSASFIRRPTVRRFRFPLAANKRKLPFSLS
jgi:hypothetical protein